ncbi:MAG: hypothetical protein OXE52_00220 [Chloroflexi bacterium]|nr:hypothetical protein [Chloroflexota bacterium]
MLEHCWYRVNWQIDAGSAEDVTSASESNYLERSSEHVDALTTYCLEAA